MDLNDSDFELDVLTLASATLILKRKVKKKKRKYQVNPYLLQRATKGRFHKDFQDLVELPNAFMENFHMSSDAFCTLYSLIRDRLEPKPHSRKDSISSKEKLCLTLEFLASGTLQRHIGSVYRISKQEVGIILEQTCEAIYATLKDSQFQNFDSLAWLETSNKFNRRWNLPNCLGAIDGKHIAIKCPANAGSLFYNYKGFHSIVLMAVSDAEYRFLYADVGAYGSEGDSTVFRESAFGKELINDNLNFPPNAMLLGEKIPYYFVGDDAFPLHKRILKPFSPRDKSQLTDEHRIFNYRLSRARRCVENSFGILCSRWTVLARTMFISPTKAQKIVSACVTLHNFLMNSSKEIYCPMEFADTISENGTLVEGQWRENLLENSSTVRPIESQSSGRPSHLATKVRDVVCKYVNSTIGSVPWQNDLIVKHK